MDNGFIIERFTHGVFVLVNSKTGNRFGNNWRFKMAVNCCPTSGDHHVERHLVSNNDNGLHTPAPSCVN